MNTLAPLNTEQLRASVPALFARHPRSDVSERYAFVDSLALTERLQRAGLVLVEAKQYNTWKNERYARHILKFRERGATAKLLRVGDVIPQVIVGNSHDRSAKLSMRYGAHRVACANGLVLGVPGLSGALYTRHLGDVEAAVEEALKAIAGFSKNVGSQIERMTQIKLDDRKQLAFARAALEVKSAAQNPREMKLAPKLLLVPRREEDGHNDLWTVFNRVQENIIKGGIAAYDGDTTRKTRPIASLATDLRINTGLWALAMKTADAAIAKAAKR